MTIRMNDSDARKLGYLAGKRSKYRNVKTVVDGITFDSRRESQRYSVLQLLRKGGQVRWFTRQVPFRLEGGVTYRADFLVVWADGSVTVEDAKGTATRVYINKRKQMKERYGIDIVEV